MTRKKDSLKLKSSQLLTNVATGEYYAGKHHDLFVNHLKYPEKVRLSAEEKIIFDRIERTKELWLHHKTDSLVIEEIKKEFNLGVAQAYNYLSDAKAMFALFTAFNPMAELMVLKERIDRAFALAEENPKAYGKLYPAAMLAHKEWIQDMRFEMERQKPSERKQFVFIYHNDWTKIEGITPEIMQTWDEEFDDIEIKARKRYQNLIVEDVSYTESK